MESRLIDCVSSVLPQTTVSRIHRGAAAAKNLWVSFYSFYLFINSPSWGLCFTAFKPFCLVGCRSFSTTIEGYFERLLESKKQHHSVEINIRSAGFRPLDLLSTKKAASLLHSCVGQGNWFAPWGGLAQGQPDFILHQLGAKRLLHQAAAQPGPRGERPAMCELICVSVFFTPSKTHSERLTLIMSQHSLVQM